MVFVFLDFQNILNILNLMLAKEVFFKVLKLQVSHKTLRIGIMCFGILHIFYNPRYI